MTGTKVTFRNGETCIIKEVIINSRDFTTCDAGMNTIEVKAGEHKTFVLEFDDGETTIANESEFEKC